MRPKRQSATGLLVACRDLIGCHSVGRRSIAILLGSLVIASGAVATSPVRERLDVSSPGTADERFDPPKAALAHARASAALVETTWYGGQDPVTGLAVEGGVWDFEDGTLQGWSSIDLTDEGIWFRHVTADSCAAHITTPCPVITEGGSTGSMWVGAHEDEARALCWPGGAGYTNNWDQYLSKTFTYGGGTVALDFDYFADSETQFDYTYVYTRVDGVWSNPLNSSAWATPEGWGYSGAHEEGTAIGTPDAPAHDVIEIQAGDLPDVGGAFDVVFCFASDPLYSDGLDSFSGYLNSRFGPFGVDDVHVSGTGFEDLATFEPDGTPTDGWVAEADDPIGSYLLVAPLEDLESFEETCVCPVDGHVMLAAVTDGSNWPHPDGQREEIGSNVAYVGSGSGVHGLRKLFRWGVWEDTPTSNGVGYRVTMDYYPWTCPMTGVVGWTLQPAGEGGYVFSGLGGARCTTLQVDNSEFVPAEVDSIRAVFVLLGECDDFGTAYCTGPEQTNQSPYWDDVRLGFFDSPDPPLSVELAFQDAYPRVSSLHPSSPIDVNVPITTRNPFYPVALLGDSAVVIGPEGIEAYLNFRVRPGPALDLGHPFFTDPRNQPGSDPLFPGWAKARLDTAETAIGVEPDRYATYYWPDGEESRATSKVLPDGLFTPGTTVEYFFTGRRPGAIEESFAPDTTGGFFLEMEALPGYGTFGGEVLAPMVLYVDAFDTGAQRVIEDDGLRPHLGTAIDDGGGAHDRWDRYDYQRATAESGVPLARQSGGENGMTRYQSMMYRTLIYNTGTLAEALRDDDAELLREWLDTDAFDRWSVTRGLWLSGDRLPRTLADADRPAANALLADYAMADLATTRYYYSATGDHSLCVRLDRGAGAHFPMSADSYASVRGNGCSSLIRLDVIEPAGDGAENLLYVDQDDDQATLVASVSNERLAPGYPVNYTVLLDAFSLHHLRSTPDGWTGTDCGSDRAAITRRVEDVFTWMNVPAGSDALWNPEDIVVAADEAAASAPRRTVLHGSSPNPFNPRTTIRFDLAHDTHVRLEVFDVTGRHVRTLADEARTAARHVIVWDGRDDGGAAVGSGIYWARLVTARGFRGAAKLVILR